MANPIQRSIAGSSLSAGSQEYGYRHRNKRHHDAGICQVIERFGEEAGPVARQHIITELKDEGWMEVDHFPRDERDYAQMGLFSRRW